MTCSHDWRGDEWGDRPNREECVDCGARRVRYSSTDEWQVIPLRTMRAVQAAEATVRNAFDGGAP